MSTFKNFSTLLKKKPTNAKVRDPGAALLLQQVCVHVQLLRELEKQLLPLLPQPLQSHCHVADLKQDILIFSVNSAVWNSRLRMLEAEIIRQIQHHPSLPEVRKIRVITQPLRAEKSTE